MGSVARPKDWSEKGESNKERKKRKWKEIQRLSDSPSRISLFILLSSPLNFIVCVFFRRKKEGEKEGLHTEFGELLKIKQEPLKSSF